MFEIKIFTDIHDNCPIEDYFKELNKKALTSKNEKIRLAKIVECIKMLQNYGTRAGLPYMKHIEDDIWELRPNKDRIFFAYYKNDTFVLLSYFTKKTNKTPPREIVKAKSNLIDFLERSERNG